MVRSILIKVFALTTRCCGHGAKKLGRIYSWYVSGGTIKVKIHKHGDSLSVTHTDDFIKHFCGVDFRTFHNRK